MINSGLASLWSSKKLLLILALGLYLVFVLANIKVHAAGSVSLSGQPSTINANVGDTVTMTVALNPNGDSVSAADIHVSYDASALQGQSITAGSLLPLVLTSGNIGNGSASITLGSQPNTPANSVGTLATLTFKALKGGTTTINLTGSQTASIGKTGNTAGSVTGTTVNVTSPTTAPTPAPTTAPTTIPTPTSTVKPTSTPTLSPTGTPSPTQAPNIVSISMAPAALNSLTGNTFSINLNMDTSTDHVSAAELHVDYDSSKIQAQSITAGSFLPVVLTSGTFDNILGLASITLGSQPSTPVMGTGTLATITFKSLTAGLAMISFDPITQTASVGKTGNSLAAMSGSDVTIAVPTPVPTPTPAPTVKPSSTAKPTPSPTKTPKPTPFRDIVPPVVHLTSPAQGAIVLRSTRKQASMVNIQATATDDKAIKNVRFYVNGVRKCRDTASPYSCNWKVPTNGFTSVYTLSVVATDSSGNTATDNITVKAK